MKWEHSFAWVRNDTVVRQEEVPEAASVDPLELPLNIVQYIAAMGAAGYEFCGTYPKADGFVIVMKSRIPSVP